ncbi:MAG: hypothetical protein QXJ34_02275 [Candidatus Pacearchaeota archaeon]
MALEDKIELQTWFGGFAINLRPDHIRIIEGTPAEEIKKNLLKNEERVSTFISIAARIVYFYRKNDKLCSVFYTSLGWLPRELAKRELVPRRFGFYGESDINDPDDCLSFMKTMLSLMDENKIKKLQEEFEPLLKTDEMPQDKSRYFIDKIPFNPQGDEIAIEIPGIEKKSLYEGGRTIDYYPIAISEDTTFHFGLEVKKGKTVIVMERISFSVMEIIKGEKVIYDVDKDWKLPQGVKRCKEWREYWKVCEKVEPKKFLWNLEFNRLGEEERIKLDRFSEIEKQALANAEIPPAIALQYAGFNGSDIIALVKANVAPEIAEKYRNSRFNGEDIVALAKANIPLDVALQYDKRFDGESIANFIKNNIAPEVAASYATRFDGNEIVTLVKNNIKPKLAASYPKKFNVDEIVALVRQGVKPQEVKGYDERFKGYEIVELVEHAIPPEIANSKRYRQMSAAKIIEDVEERRKHPVLYHIKKLFKRD